MSVSPKLLVFWLKEIVSNLKQMKPFLLLVIGKGEPVEANESNGRLFQHDPALRIKTTYDHQPLRVVSQAYPFWELY